MTLAETWGTSSDERRLPFPCDPLIDAPEAAYYRGVTIEAAAPTLFRWLCQMRVAPYSYDWIDNGGRQSPGSLTPGLEQLATGQTFMQIFDLVDFVTDQSLTLRTKRRGNATSVFGDLAVSYMIVPLNPERCRLLVKLVVHYSPGLFGAAMRVILPWGDLLMMRRQLLNLKALAEGA